VPRRQLLVFKIGCLAALLAALVHLAGYLSGPQPPANDTERELMRLATTYRFPLPGGTSRALMDLLDGFSLMFAVFLALTGGIGYIVQKRGRHDGVLMTALARALAAGYTVLLVISLMQFFIIPTIFIALVTVCFAIASVGAPRQA
jgi:hypothetical protein